MPVTTVGLSLPVLMGGCRASPGVRSKPGRVKSRARALARVARSLAKPASPCPGGEDRGASPRPRVPGRPPRRRSGARRPMAPVPVERVARPATIGATGRCCHTVQ
jgi:hypothetical protein